MVNSADLIQFMMLNTLGMSVLTETLRTASKAQFVEERSNTTEAQRCFLFVQGSGLNKLMVKFGLDYDADHLRSGFNYFYEHLS